jgi:hypothetical protein
MIGGCTNYLATMPEITIYMNCDTRLAMNLSLFDLSENDEFIFAIKNYNYIDSDYVYLYRARKSEIHPETGEIIFKITPEVSKRIKPGAFYNFSILANAFDLRVPTEYKKLTDNGAIRIEYGAQDILVKPAEGEVGYDDITGIRLEPISDETADSVLSPYASSRIVGMRVEEV